MTQEEKQLLLADLCARLPYGVICKMWGSKEENALEAKFTASDYASLESDSPYSLEYCKPYLRPMSSMTEEEKEHLQSLHNIISDENYEDGYSPAAWETISEFNDYCHEHHLDNRGLISKGLAIKAPEDMYKN